MKNIDIKTRVAIFTMVIFLCAIWGLAFHQASNLRKSLQKLLYDQQFARVTYIANSIDEALQARLYALSTLSHLITPEMIRNPDVMGKFLESQRALGKTFSLGLYAVSAEGKGIADFPVMDGRAHADYSTREYFKEVIETGKPAIGKPVIGRFAKEPVLLIAVPIKDRSSHVVAVLVGANQIHGSDLFNDVQTTNLNQYGDVFVISQKYRMFIASTDSTRTLQPLAKPGVNKMLDRYLQGFSESGIMITSKGIEALTSAAHVATNDWIVECFLPTSIAYAPIRDQQLDVYTDTSIISLLIALSVGLFLRKQLTPLKQTANLLHQMANEQAMPQSIPVVGAPEIRTLFESFNILHDKLAKKDAAREQAEKALQERNSQLEREMVERRRIEEDLHEQTVMLEEEMAKRQQLNEELHLKTVDLESEIEERETTQRYLEEQTIILEEEIVERTRIEAEHTQLEEQLLQSQKMEAIGLLAGGVAHDFNNILSVIMGYGDLLSSRLPEGKDQENALQILRASERAAELTRGLLAFSRKQTFNLEATDICQLVDENVKFLRRVIGEDIELLVAYPATSLEILVDRSQIQQVLMNLATNARDSMSTGGKLTIGISSILIDGDNVAKYCNETQGYYALIQVIDNGTGMSKETAGRIFEPFFTTKDKEKGTGLGLSMVHGIIAQHNGFILCSSEIGRGTTFSIYLPLCNTCECPAVPQEVEAAISLHGNETILLAEDDAMVMEITTYHLEANGYRVLQARDGVEALELFKKQSDEIDLVLLDAIMPKMTGKMAWDNIKAIRPDAKACFISGYTADVISGKIAVDYIIPFLRKPVLPEVLLKKVREILDSKLT